MAANTSPTLLKHWISLHQQERKPSPSACPNNNSYFEISSMISYPLCYPSNLDFFFFWTWIIALFEHYGIGLHKLILNSLITQIYVHCTYLTSHDSLNTHIHVCTPMHSHTCMYTVIGCIIENLVKMHSLFQCVKCFLGNIFNDSRLYYIRMGRKYQWFLEKVKIILTMQQKAQE